MPDARVVYVHDPMCSWCWGFRPALENLQSMLPPETGFSRLLGGLAPDTDAPMPAEMRGHLERTWQRIQQRIPGTRFNFDFWRHCRPRRSTWPACRAVIAARAQDPDVEDAMIRAIQHAYYLQARNPSDTATLVELATEIGLRGDAFADRLADPETRAILDMEMARARQMGADSFPSLRLVVGDAVWPVAVHYTDPAAMLAEIEGILGAA